jgi:hypothetical protein
MGAARENTSAGDVRDVFGSLPNFPEKMKPSNQKMATAIFEMVGFVNHEHSQD